MNLFRVVKKSHLLKQLSIKQVYQTDLIVSAIPRLNTEKKKQLDEIACYGYDRFWTV